MGNRYLICEGVSGSVDEKVLNAVLVQAHAKSVIVRPCGGDRGVHSLRAWLENESRQQRRNGTVGPPQDQVLSIEDRNYRSLAYAQGSWQSAHGKCLIWTRHEIENFLLEPRVVLRCFTNLRTSVPASWVQRLPIRLQDVEAVLLAFTEESALQHAAHVMHDFLQGEYRRHGGATELICPNPKLVSIRRDRHREQWLRAFEIEVRRLQRACQMRANLRHWPRDQIEFRFTAELDRIRRASLRVRLLDWDGHLLISRLVRYLRDMGSAAVSEDDVLAELVKALSQEYASGGLYTPDEFANLAARFA